MYRINNLFSFRIGRKNLRSGSAMNVYKFSLSVAITSYKYVFFKEYSCSIFLIFWGTYFRISAKFRPQLFTISYSELNELCTDLKSYLISELMNHSKFTVILNSNNFNNNYNTVILHRSKLYEHC